MGEKRPYQSSEEWAHEQYKKHYFLPVLFQNLKNYDAHLLIKQFHRKYTEQVTRDGTLTYDDVKVIMLNGENDLQFEIGELRFLDSFQFLSTSLDQLVGITSESRQRQIRSHEFRHGRRPHFLAREYFLIIT